MSVRLMLVPTVATRLRRAATLLAAIRVLVSNTMLAMVRIAHVSLLYAEFCFQFPRLYDSLNQFAVYLVDLVPCQ